MDDDFLAAGAPLSLSPKDSLASYTGGAHLASTIQLNSHPQSINLKGLGVREAQSLHSSYFSSMRTSVKRGGLQTLQVSLGISRHIRSSNFLCKWPQQGQANDVCGTALGSSRSPLHQLLSSANVCSYMPHVLPEELWLITVAESCRKSVSAVNVLFLWNCLVHENKPCSLLTDTGFIWYHTPYRTIMWFLLFLSLLRIAEVPTVPLPDTVLGVEY